MNIKYSKEILKSLENAITVVALFEGEDVSTTFDKINMISRNFNSKENSIDTVTLIENNNLVNVCLVGFGKRELLNREKIRIIGGNLCKKLKNILKNEAYKSSDVNVLNLNLNSDEIGCFVEGILLGNYKFDKYKTKSKDFERKEVDTITIFTEKEVECQIEKAKILANSTIIARNLVNEPSNVIYPKTLAVETVKLGAEFGFNVDVYEEEKIKALGMDAFFAVSRGSINKPRFIVMRYFGDKESTDILGLVGKGLTYDTGGYSLKSNASMLDMKTDMAGAASVIGAMCAISQSKLKKNVIAVVAACENALSGGSYKPGDIISSMAKKTIEVLNTDAEGRLTLADAIYYIINNEKVTKVVDVATLTGAALTLLGNVATPIVTNNDDFYCELEKAATLSGERVWKMPIYDEFKDMIKGEEADLKNTGGKNAGCFRLFLNKKSIPLSATVASLPFGT
ncbi:leucyl aminopeptidase [Clostridioides difficile]|uniref:leucyl aminopeptidase n=1 Tax=Clostridioides difficile TaxID=1496 RepID=UPI0029C35725|nr:leucyl aminopeptidase [Clostridioides difficile]MDX5684631.1 leucyl aminopeptidase [Clostridioides difficile]